MFCNSCDTESKDAKVWVIATIIIVIGFTVALYNVDLMLSNSDREKRLGEELRRMRTAQATLPAGVSDARQLSLVGKDEIE